MEILLSILATVGLFTIGLLVFLHKRKVSALTKQVEDLVSRYQANPSYDCQLMMADMLSGQGLYKIERIERENLFLFRK